MLPLLPDLVRDLLTAQDSKKFHDRLFQYIGSVPALFAQIFTLLGAHLTRLFRIQELHLVPRDTIGADFGLAESDLVAAVPHNAPGFEEAILLFEAQRDPQSGLPVRLLFYREGIWKQLLRIRGESPDAVKTLPLVIGGMLHLGRTPRPDPGGLEGVVPLPPESEAELLPFLGAPKLLYLDVLRAEEAVLLQAGTVGRILHVYQAMELGLPEFRVRLDTAVQWMLELPEEQRAERHSGLWSVLVLAARERSAVELGQLSEIWRAAAVRWAPTAEQQEEVAGMAQTIQQFLEAQGEARGREVGLAEGIELGKVQGIELGKVQGIELGKEVGTLDGARAMVLGLLEDRLGSVSAPVRAAVGQVAPLSELRALLTAAATVNSESEFLSRLGGRLSGAGRPGSS